jgi:hypothetical protein
MGFPDASLIQLTESELPGYCDPRPLMIKDRSYNDTCLSPMTCFPSHECILILFSMPT